MMSTELKASHGTVESMKEKLATDLKGLGTGAEDLMKGVADSAAGEFAAARTKIEGKLAEARSRLDGARLAVKERALGAADTTHVYVRENPWTALGFAAAVGLGIGLFLSRR
jgi:ElaB/YqjD/DUF883 family membrane-anchored ribosome-binding protein